MHEPWTPWCLSWFSVRQRNQRSNCQHPLDHGKSKRVQKNIYFCFIDYAKAFDCVDHKKLWKILKEMRIPDHLTCLLETYMQVRKQQLELDMEQQTDSKQENEYVKAVYCHPFNLYAEYIMRNTGLEEAEAGIKIAGRNTITSDMQMTPPLWQKVKRN